MEEVSTELPVPKEGFYLYFYATEEELDVIEQYCPGLAALYVYTYQSDGLKYCKADPNVLDTYQDDFPMLLDLKVLNFQYYMKSNRPGYVAN
jgi:hypothetical protein